MTKAEQLCDECGLPTGRAGDDTIVRETTDGERMTLCEQCERELEMEGKLLSA